MANPQIENGYTRIANELLEAIYKVSLSDYEHRIFWLIIRKTYGYKKKVDWIAQRQIVEETGIKKQNVSRTIKKLIDKSMIAKEDKKLSIQKDYDLWKLSKQITNKSNLNGLPKLSKQITKVIRRDDKSNLNRGTQKNKTIQKKIYAEFVTMEEKEYQKLVEKYGEKNTKEFIEKLNNTKGANKKLVYTSDYFAILKWVVKAVLQNKENEKIKSYRRV